MLPRRARGTKKQFTKPAPQFFSYLSTYIFNISPSAMLKLGNPGNSPECPAKSGTAKGDSAKTGTGGGRGLFVVFL